MINFIKDSYKSGEIYATLAGILAGTVILCNQIFGYEVSNIDLMVVIVLFLQTIYFKIDSK